MITIFTPTYNRAYIIGNLYESLKKQTNKDFEWLVVDDGSTDNTESMFTELLADKRDFPVRYIKQTNGGKHRAINRGVKEARGEMFFIVDSDDTLTCDAVEKIKKWFFSLDGRLKFAGVSGLRGNADNKVIGGGGNGGNYVDATNLERKSKNLLGDKAEVYYTDVLKKYPFPEFEGEKFITEEVVWNKIAADGYYIRWFSDIIYFTEYLDDGLTKTSNRYSVNPQGTLYWAKQQLVFNKGDFKSRLSAIKRYYFAVKDKKTDKEIVKDLGVCRVELSLVKFISFLKGSKS